MQKTYAFFVQATRDLGNDFTATIGAREQFLKANDNYNAFTPEFSLIKKLDQNSSIYLNAAKAFKMPNFTSLYGSGSVEFKPNPELKPEEGWTYELGYKKASNSSMFKTASITLIWMHGVIKQIVMVLTKLLTVLLKI